jgi:putative transposase
MSHSSSYNPNIHHRRSIRLKGYDYAQEGLYFITICVQNRQCLFGKIENDEMILNEYGTIAYNEWIKLPERFSNVQLDVFQIMPNHIHGIIAVGATLAVGPDRAWVNHAPTDAVAPDRARVKHVPTDTPNNDNASNDVDAPNNDNVFNDSGGSDNTNASNDGDATNNMDASDIGAPVNRAPTTTTVGDIVGAYKSLVSNACLKIFKQKWAGVNPAPTMGKLWQRNYYEHIIRNESSYHSISNYIINNPAAWKEDKFYNS